MSESIIDDIDALLDSLNAGPGIGSEVNQDVGRGLDIATQETYEYGINAGNEYKAPKEIGMGSGPVQFSVPVGRAEFNIPVGTADINMEIQEAGDRNYENMDAMKIDVIPLPLIPTVKLVRSADGTFNFAGGTFNFARKK